MFKVNNIYNVDTYKAIKEIPDKSIDLIYTDIPYLIENGGSGQSELSKRIKRIQHNELKEINSGIDSRDTTMVLKTNGNGIQAQ